MSQTPKRKRRRKHVDVVVDVDGEPAQFLVDPDVSPETMDALIQLVRAARKAIQDETLPGMKNYRPKQDS